MMSDNTDAAFANSGSAGETTTAPPPESASADSESSNPLLERESPFESGGGWDDYGKGVGEKQSTDDSEPVNETSDTEPPETDKPTDKPTDEPDEDAVLKDLFEPEAKTADDADKLTDEMVKSLRPLAQQAARRNEKKAELVKDFQFSDKPIGEVLSRFEELSPARYEEMRFTLAEKVLDANPDAVFRRAYAVKMLAADPNFDVETIPTLDDIIKNANRVEPAQPEAIDSAKTDLIDELGFDPFDTDNDEFLTSDQVTMVKAIRALEAEKAALQTGDSEKNAKYEAVERQMQALAATQTATAQKEYESAMNATITDFRTSIEAKLIPIIARNTGLEANPNDSPEIAAFKARKMELYTGTDYEKAANQSSQFEHYAHNVSAVRGEIETVINRVGEAANKETRARLAGDTAAADKYHEMVRNERIPLFTLYEKANNEFNSRFVAPDLKLFNSPGNFSRNPQQENRVEVTSSGANVNQTRTAPADYDTADDVWSGMVTDAQANQRFRSGA